MFDRKELMQQIEGLKEEVGRTTYEAIMAEEEADRPRKVMDLLQKAYDQGKKTGEAPAKSYLTKALDMSQRSRVVIEFCVEMLRYLGSTGV